ncbi:hypothetical protein [Cellulophaga sp. Hel_I_12]|uniref:hypothetical protein n=1 Tax=Cellulophaga sp. Hel_I_12 TaxID=1249972 RepID=UPI000645DBC8|nr:hypothetical protein [Cellulophaga sp. Hel_I_12]
MSILKSLNFGGNEVLQRNQMKSVLGGNNMPKIKYATDCVFVEGVWPPGCPCTSNEICDRGFSGYGLCINGRCQ